MKQRVPLILSGLALFFSMTGAGFAATGFRITSIWQIAPKVRHALKGERGPRGPAGSRGTLGATGTAGTVNWAATYFLAGPTTTVPSDGSDATAAVQCHPGDHALTGGFVAHNAVVRNDSLVIGARSPSGAPADGWFAIGHVESSDGAGDLTAWIRCVGY